MINGIKSDRELKNDSYSTLIPPPLAEDDGERGMYIYVTEIYTDFMSRASPLTIQDPVWINYELDGCQVRLNQPLLFDVTDIKQVRWHWKCNAALFNLWSIMASYISDDGVKSDRHYYMDMKLLLTDLQNQYDSSCGSATKSICGSSFIANFVMSIIMICIKDAFESLNVKRQKILTKENMTVGNTI